MRSIEQLVVHCSATTPSMDIGANEIRQWHKHRGFRDIGYHYVIRRSGEVEKGRPEFMVGAHAKGYNENSIGICLVGGLDKSHTPDANFTLEQYIVLAELVSDLMDKYGDEVEIVGHRDIPNVKKACPCFDVKAFFSEGV